jgi:drug/metabolite transporter (DMT)-like permease
MFITFAARVINSNIVTATVNTISIIIPLLIVLPSLNKKIIENGKAGIFAALIAGILISLYTLSLNKSFQINKIAIVTPIVFGGMIFLTSILSYFFFKEKVSLIQFSGLTFLGIGLLFIIYAAYTGK